MSRLAAMVVPVLLWMGCGQVYRPVVIPCSAGGVPGCPVETPPTPDNFHAVFSINTNLLNYPGGAMQIDVSGDTIIGETPTDDPTAPNLGDNPTSAAILSNDSRVFVTSAGSVLSAGLDVVSSFTPVFQSRLAIGLGAVATIGLPSGSQPVFVNTTQSNAVYVANFGTNSVSAINTSSNVVSNTATVGLNPVALAEMPNGLKIYVANQGDNTVSSLNAVDLSQNTVTGFSGVAPVWVVARGDNQKVYVVTQGDGQLVTIDTATDTVSSSISMGGGASGANFIYFDPILNRLYVVNPVTSTIFVFSDTGGANDTPLLLATIPFTSGSAACPNGCTPVSVTALPDGSRFYVASYQANAACPQGSGVTGACVIPGLTVFDANTFTLMYPNVPTLTLLTGPPACTVSATNPCTTSWPFSASQSAVPPVATCATAPGTLYSPSATRFRVFTTAAEDGSHVYMSMCDAGAIADIITNGNNANNTGGGIPADTLITDLLTAPAASSGTALQNPIFLLAGQ